MAERELSPPELLELVEASSSALIVRDWDGHIIYWNDGACELYGWSKAEAVGKISHELLQTVFPQPRAEIEQQVKHQGKWEGLLTHTCKDGSTVNVKSEWSSKKTPGPQPEILEVNANITEQKRAEQRLAEMNQIMLGNEVEIQRLRQKLSEYEPK